MLSFNFEGWLETLNCPNVSAWINGMCVLECMASPWLQISGLDCITLVSTDAGGHLTCFRLPPTAVKRHLLCFSLSEGGLDCDIHPHCAAQPWPGTAGIPGVLLAHCHLQDAAVGTHVEHSTSHYRGQPKSCPAPPANWPKPCNFFFYFRPQYSRLGQIPNTDIYKPVEDYNQVWCTTHALLVEKNGMEEEND